MATFRTQPTPNPNSLKIIANDAVFLDEGMESFSSAEEAAGHPLGERLFDVTGVANVFITPEFVTVTKHPAANWSDLSPTLESILNAYVEEREA